MWGDVVWRKSAGFWFVFRRYGMFRLLQDLSRFPVRHSAMLLGVGCRLLAALAVVLGSFTDGGVLGQELISGGAAAGVGREGEGMTGGESGVAWEQLIREDLGLVWRAYPSEALSRREGESGSPVWHVERGMASDGDVEEFVLICSGHPRGFLWTAERFGDFELRGEWRYPKDADGNSGFLLFAQAEERLWPTSIQIQLHQPKAGSIFPSGDARTDNVVEVETSPARPIGQWNECRIVCRGGTITMEMNGRRVGEVRGAWPAAGHLALQSEGAEVHFRRLRIRRLESAAATR
jgi:hypothetical protein